MSKIDMTGLKFGRLTVIGPAKNRGTRAYWVCKCECGRTKEIRGWSLRNGNVQSCGCEKGLRHGACTGGRPKRIYNIWRDMRDRCKNPNNVGFELYGARGISVCQEWEDFQSFWEWAKRTGYSDSLTLDRVDSNGGYNPDNCRWITNSEQQRNKRNNVFVTVNGETKCLAEWARVIGIRPQVLSKVKAQGKNIEKFIRDELRKKEGVGDDASGIKSDLKS